MAEPSGVNRTELHPVSTNPWLGGMLTARRRTLGAEAAGAGSRLRRRGKAEQWRRQAEATSVSSCSPLLLHIVLRLFAGYLVDLRQRYGREIYSIPIRRGLAARHQISRFVLKDLDLADETIADRGHGLDVSRAPGLIAQQPPQQSDAARQGILSDSGIAPHRVQQFLFRDQLPGVAEQESAGLETLSARPAIASPALKSEELPLSDLHVGEPENKRTYSPSRFHQSSSTPLAGN